MQNKKEMLDERLKRAAENGDLKGTKAALAAGAGGFIFAFAKSAEAGHFEIVELLRDALKARGEWSSAESFTSYSLFQAVRNGNLIFLKNLLAVGADPNYIESGNTALIMAAHEGHLEIVEALLDAGADIQVKDKFGMAAALYGNDSILALMRLPKEERRHLKIASLALLQAAKDGALDSAKAALEAGADIERADAEGKTALMLAAHGGHAEIVKTLLTDGARLWKDDREIFDLAGAEEARQIIRHKYAANAKLLEAAEKGDLDSVKAALAEGAQPSCGALSGARDEEIVKILLAAGVNTKGFSGWSALRKAAENGWIEIVKELLEKGAPVDLHDYDGCEPLNDAVISNSPNYKEIVKLLLGAGADPNIMGSKLRTDLFFAADRRNPEIVVLLLDHGAKINARDEVGSTTLMHAASRDFPDICKLLIERGADTRLRDISGRNAFDYAEFAGGETLQVLRNSNEIAHAAKVAKILEASMGKSKKIGKGKVAPSGGLIL